jgi:DNA-binding NarL/FixJ family response regulator
MKSTPRIDQPQKAAYPEQARAQPGHQLPSAGAPLRIGLICTRQLCAGCLTHVLEHTLETADIRTGNNVDQLRAIYRDEPPQIFIYSSILPYSVDPVELKQLCDEVIPAPVIVHVEVVSITQVQEIITTGAKGIIPTSVEPKLAGNIVTFVAAGGSYFPTFDGIPGTLLSKSMESISRLTPKQISVLRLAIDGLSNKEIARQLGVAENTIKFHIASLMKKLKVENRVQLAVVASRSLPV